MSKHTLTELIDQNIPINYSDDSPYSADYASDKFLENTVDGRNFVKKIHIITWLDTGDVIAVTTNAKHAKTIAEKHSAYGHLCKIWAYDDATPQTCMPFFKVDVGHEEAWQIRRVIPEPYFDEDMYVYISAPSKTAAVKRAREFVKDKPGFGRRKSKKKKEGSNGNE